MNTIQLQSCLLKILKHKDFQIGVLASDELTLVERKKFLIVVNSEPSFLPGQHWVAFLKIGKNLEFFDSFGKDVDFYGSYFKLFVKSHGGKVIYNNTQLQSNESFLCGQYCLFFLFCRNHNMKYKRILECFSKWDLNANDVMISQFYVRVQAILHKKLKHCKCFLKSTCIQENCKLSRLE
jgi:hypothetical protein